MPRRDIVVIGASAGGVEALQKIAKHLPNAFPAAVLVVLHRPAEAESVLPRILNRAGPLDAVHAVNGQEIHPGRIYIAPPDVHLILQNKQVHLWRGPTENGARPAIDPLFRTAAENFGSRVIGVILTGNGDDGTAGLAALKQWGGIAIVQDPDEALYASMPANAIEYVDVDYVLPLAQIPATLVQLAGSAIEAATNGIGINGAGMKKERIRETTMASENKTVAPEQGEASGLTCPACGGALWEVNESGIPRYRCHIGHVFSLNSIEPEQSKVVERALSSAVRALEERAGLLRRLADRVKQPHRAQLLKRYEDQAQEAEKNAKAVRSILLADRPQVSEGEGGPKSRNEAVPTET